MRFPVTGKQQACEKFRVSSLDVEMIFVNIINEIMTGTKYNS